MPGKSKRAAARPARRKKALKRRDHLAASLADPRYRKRVVNSAASYKRKQKPIRIEEDEIQ